MISTKEVKASLKRIIKGDNEITSQFWDAALAQNVGHVIKRLECDIESRDKKIAWLKGDVEVEVEMTGTHPGQTIVDDHWS